ncbi:MAG: ABC transporter substrate-binding protein, partial [Ruminiclostridium sp.]|nr:ABC transporter substrate-binding protein [Ruminiclostridium sp.]
MKKILALTLSLVMACSLCLTACGGQEEPPESSETAVNVNYGISNAWDSLMPYYSVSGSNYSRIIYDKIYDRLAYVRPDGACSPRGADSWESADDGYAILFHLNRDAAFHDGTPVTAQHWADTIALVTNPVCEAFGRPVFAALTGTDETGAAVSGEKLGAEAVDDYTLKLSFKAPVIPEEFLVNNNREVYVLPTHLLADIPAEEVMTHDFWLSPVGSGPCVFLSELAGSSLTLAANKDYPLGAPGFDTLTITVMDKANLLTALIAGDLDYYAFGGSVSEENRPIAEEAGFTVQEGTVPSTFYELMLNNESIADAKIRQAINLALDKELLCLQSTGTMGFVTHSSILPDTPYSGGKITGTYDPEGAKALLAEAGYSGETYTLACTSARASLAALIQQNLTDAGLAVEIETVDSATMFAGMFDGTYDMAVASHTPTNLPLWFTG